MGVDIIYLLRYIIDINMARYEIALFLGQHEENPIFNYLISQNEKQFQQIIITIQRLSRVGQDLLDTSCAKRLGDELFELRQNRHRITYHAESNRFILLSAFLKSTNRTPAKELELAQSRIQEYRKLRKTEVMRIPAI